ncbi:hypothetical protein DFH07DRAFT_520991 [Mycena maculata]|uniref:F-box domain-containing protein n=1 Tax=Mycena maculata TaxID=230809 RepID=A0AAD7IZ57_9AGAR|nr:hypothetical protein DFH07DRAFT_520991 [Mycena maculata]
MSVQKLEASLEKLSANIALQKEVLKKLENSKIRVQRQLNSIRDPVARLPLEISSEIFVQCLSPRSKSGSPHIPILLSNVCNTWYNIALSTPRLWAVIHVDFPHAESFKQGLETWSRRARNCYLSISLAGAFNSGVGAVLSPYVHRLVYLEINLVGEGGIGAFLEDMGQGTLPFLKTVRIHDSTVGYGGCSAPCILELLRLAPDLAEFMTEVSPVWGDDSESPEQLVLPALRRLMFGGRSNLFGRRSNLRGDDEILKYLSLPNLQSLHLPMQIEDNGLLEFLQRSVPPLQELMIGDGCRDIEDFTCFERCVLLVPTLTRLELSGPSDLLVEEFFSALAESPTHMLPNLRSLIMHLDMDTITPPDFWTTVLRALSKRRGQLTYFMIAQYRWTIARPESEVCAAFRQLAVNGMGIYVGTEEGSIVSA